MPSNLIVISGLSGAGKSTAMHALEDLGYFCVDNLPLALLPALVMEMFPSNSRHHHDRVAVAIDARNPGYPFEQFPDIIQHIRARGIDTQVLFLEAEQDILIKRFSETRRKHPLTSENLALSEAVQREGDLLFDVRKYADFMIDTSHMHLHQLRDMIRQRVDQRPTQTLSVLFQSFGFKNGPPRDADIMFDARCLPNPHWHPDLRPMSGKDEPVIKFLEAEPLVGKMLQSLKDFLEPWIPAFEAENRSYLTIAVGCTGGHHRSVYLVESLAEHFAKQRAGILIRHRDLS